MKLSNALYCLACLIGVGFFQAKASSDNDAEVILENIFYIISDSVTLADQNNNNQKENSIQTGVSILGHLGSIIAHIAHSRHDQSAQPMTADELATLLTNDRELAEQIQTALVQSKHRMKSLQNATPKPEL